MKLMPNTLMGRTVILIALLIVLSQVAWFGIVRLFFIPPLREAHANPVVSNILMARTALTSLPPGERQPFLDSLNAQGGFRIVASAHAGPVPVATDQHPPVGLSRSLEAAVGPNVSFRTDSKQHDLWVGFPVQGERYWLILPRGHIRPVFPLDLLIWVVLGVAIAVLGAWLVIFRLNRQLQRVLEAARRLGRGETPAKLPETGPEEVRDLSRGFNQMAAGLQLLDGERRLMLAGISHDLRTPLTRLRISIELAEQELETTLRRGMVHDIDDMDSILMQFLDYARDGREEPLQYADFNQIVFDICHRYQISGTPITLRLGDCPNFRFRKLAMRRVISNLMDNAVHHGGQQVEVHTYSDAYRLAFEVMDRGPGLQHLPPSEIIKPFVREDHARGQRAGAGLGLSITERMVKLHGGTLRLANREGGGLLARVEIPVFPELQSAPTDEAGLPRGQETTHESATAS